MNIYVGNLSFAVGDDKLRELFAAHGVVESAQAVADRRTGRPRGYGFVVMPDDDQARAAIAALNDFQLDGRKLIVQQAKSPT